MFRLIDSLNRIVILTKDCWHNHIVVRHPIMQSLEQELQETILDPDRIYKSKVNKNALLYFKKYSHLKYGKFYLMVVVEFDANKKKGYTKTSFPVYNLKKGVKLIWKKN